MPDSPLTPPLAGVTTAGRWAARRDEIRGAWRTLAGTVPPADAWPITPALRLGERRFRGGVERRLAVGTPPLGLRLLVPDGGAPRPVLLTQSSHPTWTAAALRRGWAACTVDACDVRDDTEAVAGAFGKAYDGGRIAWRAWALSRALDVLALERDVDAAHVVVAGHSRNGKAALLAAAFDERFAAVVSSSSGVLGAIPARLCRERHFGEGIELLTRHYPRWYHPRLREWAGREEELPTDAHELLALAAPTPVLVSVAVHDPVESTWAAEASVAAARPAYALHGVPEALELRYRGGGHELSSAAVEAMLDWITGDRGRPSAALHPGDGGPFVATAPAARPLLRGVALARALGAALGDAPPRASAGAVPHARGERDHTAWLHGRGRLRGRRIVTADGVDVTVLGPADGPAALWLGPPCRATGWIAGYADGPGMPEVLAADGWSVACHDPIGAGARLGEGAGFTRRHPRWSVLGRMVADAAGVAEAAGAPAWIAAYGTGAVVAAHLAAVRPDLVSGAVLVAPTADDPLLPAGTTPAYTLADLLAAAACSVTVLGAARDPQAGAVAAACAAAGVEHVALDDWHRLPSATSRRVAALLAGAIAAA